MRICISLFKFRYILIVFFFGSDFLLDSDSWPKNIHLVPILFVRYTASCPIPAPVIESLRCVLQMFLKGPGLCSMAMSSVQTPKGTGVTYSPIRFDFMSKCMSLIPWKPPETFKHRFSWRGCHLTHDCRILMCKYMCIVL